MIDKRYAITIASIHLLACAAYVPWLFSWSGVALLVAGIYFYGLFGLDMAYHRLLTHRSFACSRWLEHLLAIVGVCCGEDSPLEWVTTHRMHHAETDKHGDPHSPRESLLHSHVGWLFYRDDAQRGARFYDRYARDLLADRFYRRLQRGTAIVGIYLGHAALYGIAGFLAGGAQLAASWVVFGVFARTVCVWHFSWSVNSLAHRFGYRNFPSRDQSRNNWLVAFFTSGEGWHANHHHAPTSATTQVMWWEFDPVYYVICALEFCGLVWDVKRPALAPQPITNEVDHAKGTC